MNLNQGSDKNVQAPLPNPPSKATEEENARYADALIEMVNIEYTKQHPNQAKQSRFLTTKQIVILAIILLVTIVGTVVLGRFGSLSGSNSSGSGTSTQTKQLLHSAQTFNNSGSY